MMERDWIYVTKPVLPRLKDFNEQLKRIWESGVLTNGGQIHDELERKLSEYLGVPHISLTSNGTSALELIAEAYQLEGEVITTPFTFVATAHALRRRNVKLRFADVRRGSYSLCEESVERLINERTTAIVGVHCYGIPCRTKELRQVADRYGLRLIYDAAHAFGVDDKGGSVLRHGDMSAVSLHATKVMTSCEGGIVISRSREEKEKIDSLKNFGFDGVGGVEGLGTNAKMSELHAAMGICQLNQIEGLIEKRKVVFDRYLERLNEADVGLLDHTMCEKYNYSYMPVLLKSRRDDAVERLLRELKGIRVEARRYFYPLVTDLDSYSDTADECPNAAYLAERIVCLPIFPELGLETVDDISDVVLKCCE